MKKALTTIAFSSALILTAMATPSLTAATLLTQDNDHHEARSEESHPEYTSNSYYRLGNREGYQDYERKAQRKGHHHKYRNDDDKKAHDYGYQQGWQGQRADHDNHDPH
jgi:hypothetical protein